MIRENTVTQKMAVTSEKLYRRHTTKRNQYHKHHHHHEVEEETLRDHKSLHYKSRENRVSNGKMLVQLWKTVQMKLCFKPSELRVGRMAGDRDEEAGKRSQVEAVIFVDLSDSRRPKRAVVVEAS